MAATILSQAYAYTEEKVREWPVPSGTAKGTAILSASNQPGVTLTPRGDATASKTLGGVYTLTYPNGAVGQRSDSAQVATDGSWAGPVVGATSSTAKNTLVYIDSTGALTLTASGNTKFGVVDSYPGKASSTDTTVKIGVFA
jgi:hypothetical protein